MVYRDVPLKDLLSLTVHEATATELLAKFPTIKEIAEAAPEELAQVKGIGHTRANALLAAIELGKRLYTTPAAEKPIINSPQDVFNLLSDMQFLDREYFKAINLNTKNMILAIDTISIGSLNSSLVHPRELFKAAIKRSANSLILAHNHPSGIPDPSREDLEVTRRLLEAGKLLGIEVVDHVLIGAHRYVSLKERELI